MVRPHGAAVWGAVADKIEVVVDTEAIGTDEGVVTGLNQAEVDQVVGRQGGQGRNEVDRLHGRTQEKELDEAVARFVPQPAQVDRRVEAFQGHVVALSQRRHDALGCVALTTQDVVESADEGWLREIQGVFIGGA